MTGSAGMTAINLVLLLLLSPSHHRLSAIASCTTTPAAAATCFLASTPRRHLLRPLVPTNTTIAPVASDPPTAPSPNSAPRSTLSPNSAPSPSRAPSPSSAPSPSIAPSPSSTLSPNGTLSPNITLSPNSTESHNVALPQNSTVPHNVTSLQNVTVSHNSAAPLSGGDASSSRRGGGGGPVERVGQVAEGIAGAVEEAGQAVKQLVQMYTRPNARPRIPLGPTIVKWLKRSPIPQQVHVSLASVAAGGVSMRVTWITTQPRCLSLVTWGLHRNALTHLTRGTSNTYQFLFYRSGFIHSVVLGSPQSPLRGNTVYHYRMGRKGRRRSFKTPPTASDASITVALVGDLGQSGWTVKTLKHVGSQPHDMVIVPGDLSYADYNPWRWDSWSTLIDPYASTRPWMVVPGNHDVEAFPLMSSFRAYNARWPMPAAASASPSNLFYSFKTAGIHWVMLSSYSPFRVASQQYAWLKRDLSAVDRARTPWLVAVVHEPWYSSNARHHTDGTPMRKALEGLLFAARTDILFAGHVHAYERSVRMHNGRPHACGMIHITIGDGGNREGLYTTYDSRPAWSVFREASFGHGRLQVQGGSNVGQADWSWQRNADDVAEAADSAHFISLASALAPSQCRPLSAQP